jgi:ubiquinone/menaquinone biosynthesis C-methylase UbiE
MDVTTFGITDASFDAIVSTFLFCVLDDQFQQTSLEELCRFCKPGGTIYILEYSISPPPLHRFITKIWAPWVRYAYVTTFARKT